MSQLSITTTQNVNINFNTATVGERILAALIDLVIKACYITFVYYIIIEETGLSDYLRDINQWSAMAISSLLFLPVMFYSIVLESLMDGQTVGKKLMKMRVIKLDGYQAGFGDYLIRWLFRPLEIVYFMVVVGIIALVATKKTQRLGDMAAGTGIISLKNDVTIDHTILREVGGDYVPTYPLVIKLTDNDVRIIKETLDSSRRAADFATLQRLQSKVEAVTGIKSTSKNSLDFIDTIIKDYNYYTQNM
ncbi:transporter [Flavobacterium akiainvivens]|uniref:Transporter n=1 Tax=Flavobacterium akiainvivens TaxID=1202724 RepID=A0A0M9VJX4_9FLAO|nr:RDD family protein [Flavobacterium akiainvivens]KOS07932.1 transporter [Flavobacterium akiainvivens]SFQ29148.1 Uncharacterized membrane protein YckC, RDD family [Flavobacterium akiainvivens]